MNEAERLRKIATEPTEELNIWYNLHLRNQLEARSKSGHTTMDIVLSPQMANYLRGKGFVVNEFNEELNYGTKTYRVSW